MHSASHTVLLHLNVLLRYSSFCNVSALDLLSVVVFPLLLAMVLLGRAIHYGCSQPFKAMVERIVPAQYLYSGVPFRDLDYCEIFAGRGHLSQAMAEAT